MKLVMIEWLDSFGCSTTWQELDHESDPEPMACRSVGWLLYDGKGCKVIVPHLAEPAGGSEQGCGDMTIPTACIKSIQTLNPD